jgi:ketosteroid isomerase-like protein
MSAKAGPGWGSSLFPAIRPGEVTLAAAEQFAVQQAVARYAFALDQQDLVALESVLAEDATWAFKIAGETDLGPIVGREAILEFVRASIDAETDQRRHNLVNMVLRSADADTAVVHAYLMLTSNSAGGSGLIATGFYVFRLEYAETEWRIADLFLGADNSW